MATVEELKLQIKADVAEAVGKLKQYQRTAKETGDSNTTLGATFARMRDVMQGPVAAGKMVIDAFKKIKAVTDALEDSWAQQEFATSNLEAVLKSTGNIVGLTSKELHGMALELQKVTKFGDETTIAAQAVLLTFKEIGGDIFPGVIETAMDMSTVMGSDLQTAIVQIGKALNEPIEGIGALRKVGVQLTDDQSEMVKSFMAVDDIASAQKVIMGELASEFGGAARAAGETASAVKVKLGNALGDLNEELGQSISRDLKPWREAWIRMAEGIGAALKAQNDFNEAMDRTANGTASNQDKLLVAEQQLADLQQKRITQYDKRGVDSSIKSKEDEIKAIKEQIRLVELYKGRTDSAAESEIKNAEQLAKYTEKRAKDDADALKNIDAMDAVFEEWGDDVLTTWGLLDGLNKGLEQTIDSGNDVKQISDAWGDWTIQIGESSIALDAVIEKEERLKDATESAYSAMGKTMADSLLEGEGLWKSFAKAGLEAVAAVIESYALEFGLLAGKAFLTGNIVQGAGYTALSAAAYTTAGLVRAIPMAEGGSGTVDKPTLFLAGEAGKEDFAFVPHSKGGMQSGGGTTIVQNISGSIWTTQQLQSLAVGAVKHDQRGF